MLATTLAFGCLAVAVTGKVAKNGELLSTFVAARVREIAKSHEYSIKHPEAGSKYEKAQSSKLQAKVGVIRRVDKRVESSLYKHWVTSRREPWTRPEYKLAKSSVLCVGARLGGEVRVLTMLGALAVGIDFNPGERNPWVQWGDATRLQFANETFDFVYTNVIDHITPLEKFAVEAMRVLKPGGKLVLHVAHNAPDAWSTQTFEGEGSGSLTTDSLIVMVQKSAPALTLAFRKVYGGKNESAVDNLVASFRGGDEVIFEKGPSSG